MKKLIALFSLIIVILTLTGCDEKPVYRQIKTCVLKQEYKTESGGAFIILYAAIQSKKSVETNYYIYIKGIEGFRLQKINSNNLEIVETNEMEPQIKGIFSYDGKIIDYEDYIAYVPEGTITQEYKAEITGVEDENDN